MMYYLPIFISSRGGYTVGPPVLRKREYTCVVAYGTDTIERPYLIKYGLPRDSSHYMPTPPVCIYSSFYIYLLALLMCAYLFDRTTIIL